MLTRRDFVKVTTVGSVLATFGEMADAKDLVKQAAEELNDVSESEKEIPVIEDVDLVIVGGSSGAVAAAGAAARSGCKVFLVASLPYLGDDICGTLRLVCGKEEKPANYLSRRLFLQSKSPTPLYIKTELENELIDNGVNFLYSSYVTNVLTDDSRQVAGVVIANRSGRQAIRAKAVIDATHTAAIAKMAGAKTSSFNPGEYEFGFVAVGNTRQDIPGLIQKEKLPYSLSVGNKQLPVNRYTFRLPVKDESYATLQEIEQIIRDRTWDADQGDSSDVLEYLPFTHILSSKPFTQDFLHIRKIPLEAFQPQGVTNLWVVGPAADVSRQVAEKLMKPVFRIALGEIIGEVVALRIAGRTHPDKVQVLQEAKRGDEYGKIGELLLPLRPAKLQGYAFSPKASLPILGNYDVVIMGGGTAGAPAGIAAARQGVKTLVLEYLHGLGGIMTQGFIGKYWDGFRGGFSALVDEGVRNMAPLEHPRQLKDWKDSHNADWKQEYFRRELRKAGGELWFGVTGCGVIVRDHCIKGVVVATPFGRGVIKTKVVIDSTGSADMAIAAGAEYSSTGQHVAVQGAGMGNWTPYDFYNNNDWAFIDDTDILDVSRVYVQAKKKNAGKYDMVKLPQTRERRRVVGEYSVSVYDVLNHRRYPDTISYHQSSFDTHGMIVDPYFILSPPQKRHAIYNADVPLRALLPKGLEGILTTGLGASADRDAMPVIRMQSCLQNQGFAVGYLAAQAVKENKPLRKVDMKKIQKYLVEIGNLPERVLKDKAFKGYSKKELENAAGTVHDNYKGLEILLTQPESSEQLLLNKMKQGGSVDEQVIYASILCMLENKQYASVLADKIKSFSGWDKGWHYTGMGQFGTCMSRLDALIIALGSTGESNILPIILDKAGLLLPEDYFSHFRAVAVAAERIGSKDAVPVLFDLLQMPGMQGHSLSSYKEARKKTVPALDDVSVRNYALKELHIARALYRCGDKDGLGEKILKEYKNGLQGHYARYAGYVLND